MPGLRQSYRQRLLPDMRTKNRALAEVRVRKKFVAQNAPLPGMQKAATIS